LSTREASAAAKPPSIPAGLFETDQLLRRWGGENRRYINSGGIHPLERIRLLRDGAVFSAPAPEPGEYEIIDQILATSPDDTRAFIIFWYEPSRTVIQKANVMNRSRAQAYNELKNHLSYMKGRLNARGVWV